MRAEFATINNDYMVDIVPYDGTVRAKHRGTCLGWNHTHDKMLFAVQFGNRRFAVAIPKDESIQPVE